MNFAARLATALLCTLALLEAPAHAQGDPGYKPTVGQPGRDVVWVPTPPVLVEKMLDVAGVTADDYVMDLGSGDGRNIIAAAKRGARALGVEFNPDMVAISRRAAEEAGVADKAQFVQGDMFEADVSQASVLALFLLTTNLNKLVDKFLAMKPGTRIVLNGFGIDGWTADETGRADGDCGNWCTWMLYIVPAKVAGKWQLRDGTLELAQDHQMVTGTWQHNGRTLSLTDGRLRGDRITFTLDNARYIGRVEDGAIRGVGWSATRLAP